jgi:hypothetical protein
MSQGAPSLESNMANHVAFPNRNAALYGWGIEATQSLTKRWQWLLPPQWIYNMGT